MVHLGFSYLLSTRTKRKRKIFLLCQGVLFELQIYPTRRIQTFPFETIRMKEGHGLQQIVMIYSMRREISIQPYIEKGILTLFQKKRKYRIMFIQLT